MSEGLRKYYYSILVILIIPLAGMSTDVYIPSLPAMALYFLANKNLVQYTVTSYVLAMGVGQLFAGPISDAFGRKKPLLVAVLIQIISIAVILLSSNIFSVILARFFQGLGAAFMIVPARAILNDVFTGAQLKKQFGYLTIAFAMGPIVAPFLGGYLQQYIGWKANFYFILIYAVTISCLVIFTYKETAQHMHSFALDKFWKNYKIIMSNKYFLIGSVFLGMLIGYTGVFNVTGTFLVQTTLQKSSVVYGHIALLMGFGWFLGNTINRFAFHIDKHLKTKIALFVSFLSAILMFFLALKGYLNLVSLALPTFIILTMSGAIFSIYVAECLTLFPKLAASANGGLFSIVWFIFSVLTFVGTFLGLHSLLPLAITYLLVSALCLLLYLWLISLPNAEGHLG